MQQRPETNLDTLRPGEVWQENTDENQSKSENMKKYIPEHF